MNDFAQNYLCLHQNEPQGMHWEHKQVTLHPTVAYFKCPNSTCGKLCTHEAVHVSEDLKHDAHLVKKFNEKTLEVLKERKIAIHKIIHFSDQAPSQYKNKTTFKYISNSKLCWMCNFFGVRHGKGPCDGCAGRVKQQVSLLVKTEEFVVNSALSFYEVCHSKLQKNPVPNECSHFVQTFYFTLKLPTRPKTGSWPGIPDTHKLHSIVNNPGSKILNIRMKLCCCYNCLHGTGPCTNNVCPEDWSAYDLRARKAVKPNL